ncbi:MAG: hypothetical protein CMJ81_20150 [Planctomycetaceae bacterium]|nr:hypothetical protein [Planctomycetaceae bacterium]MBP62602.1 hypothetical protein [Planctomycetaceae bacterium]
MKAGMDWLTGFGNPELTGQVVKGSCQSRVETRQLGFYDGRSRRKRSVNDSYQPLAGSRCCARFEGGCSFRQQATGRSRETAYEKEKKP